MGKKSFITFNRYFICGLFLCMFIACESATISVKQAEEQPTVQKISSLPFTPDGQICFFFLTDREGWLAIIDKGVWKTLDGGKTWDRVFSANDSWEVSKLYFIDSNIGWAIVSPQGLYKTADGGKTWALQKPPFPKAAIYSIVFFAGGKEGWACGDALTPPPREYKDKVPEHDNYAVISHTLDGGMTWHQQIIPDTRIILDLFFLNPSQGWALGWPGLFSYKKDSGVWKEEDLLSGECEKKLLAATLNPDNVVWEPSAIFFLNPSQGWLCFKDGTLVKTTGGGKSWCDLLDLGIVLSDEEGWNRFFQKLYFTSLSKGWGLTAGGSLYKTEDGGVSWSKVDSSVTFSGMYFLDAQHGWLIAEEGVFRIVL